MQTGIVHGDALHIIPKLTPQSVQCIFIDPPYNIGMDYGNGKVNDSLPPKTYLAQMAELFRLCVSLLAPTGSLWVLINEPWADHFGNMLSELLPRRNRIIWRETFGQYCESRFPSGHRHIFWHVVDPKQSPFYTDNIRVQSQRMLAEDPRAAGPRVPDDVWEIPRLVGNAKERNGGHPCQLPEKLLERIILSSTADSDLVFDPMAGTGTTLRVAQRLGRKYLGIEKQEEFADIIRSRLANTFQQSLF